MPRKPRKEKGEHQTEKGEKIVSTADLARYLNISQWTVSRALNGHTDISEETRQRVLDCMQELGFQPNPFARGLRGRSLGMVGIGFTRLNIPILDMKVFGMQQLLSQKNYRCLIETTSNKPENEKKIFANFHRLHLDGAIIFQSVMKPEEMQPYGKLLPMVSVDPWLPQPVPSVTLDRYHAMRMLMRHLLDLKHRRFALLGITPDYVWRWPAMADTVAEHGLNPDDVFDCHPIPPGEESSLELGHRMAEAILKKGNPPTAFVCLDDLMAVGAVECIRKAGLSIPRDISVTGFNYQDIAWVLSPTLTTIDQQPSKLVELACDLLMQQIELPAEERGKAIQLRSDPRLVVGESTGPAKV